MVYGLAGVLAIALLIAAFTDLRRRQIDNWLNAAIAALAQLGVALAAFVVLAGLFALRMMGGGDVKLLTALALWLRPVLFAKLAVCQASADHGPGGRPAHRGDGHVAPDAAPQGPAEDSLWRGDRHGGAVCSWHHLWRGHSRARCGLRPT